MEFSIIKNKDVTKGEEMSNKREKKKWSTKKKVVATLVSIVALFLIIVLGYVAYVFGTYHRIPDKQKLSINKPASSQNANSSETSESKNVKTLDTSKLTKNKEYKIGTYNVGFGAYTPTYSFFMDGGKYSRCFSKQSGIDAINGAADYAMEEKPDFMIFQEVDRKSTRSYHVSQENLITEKFANYYEDFAVNYDSAYLFYPFNEPIGKSYSGIAFYSKYLITSAVRRSFPISTSFSKILDLDRCYSVSRIPADGGKELVVYSVHMSAYGNSDEIREGQTSMLFNDMKEERQKGNYVICGGDFNHNLKLDENDNAEHEGWAYPFPRSKMPKELSFAMNQLSKDKYDSLAPSNRNTDMEYIKGKTFTCILDGFIISDNVQMTDYTIKDNGFKYSDHQPVFMSFKLK